MSQLLLSSMFIRVSKEENQANVEKIAVVDWLAQAKKKDTFVPKIVKWLVGRPHKEKNLVMTLLPNNIIMGSQPCSIFTGSWPLSSDTKHKGRRPYTNWFTLELWPPIVATMKQHKNHTLTLKYLRIAYHIKRGSTRSNDKLSKGILNEWFTNNGKVWIHAQACVAR
jgi:hypothetical protein